MRMVATMKVSIVLILVSIIQNSSAGCCGCKNTFNAEFTGFYNKVQNEFNSVLKNGSLTCSSCPPCDSSLGKSGSGKSRTSSSSSGTSASSTSDTSAISTTCPHLHQPTPEDGVCRKITFRDDGPDFIVENIDSQLGVAARGYDVVVLSSMHIKIGHKIALVMIIRHYNRNQYCGFRPTEKPFVTPLKNKARGVEIAHGYVYVTGGDNEEVWRRPLKRSKTKQWTKFITGEGQNFQPNRINWSKDGEKMFLLSLKQKNPIHVYNKKGEKIGAIDISSCAVNGYSPTKVHFDLEGNLQVVCGPDICLYNSVDYNFIKKVRISVRRFDILPSAISGLYTHCDGSMVASDSGGAHQAKLLFMDKNYRVTNIARNLVEKAGSHYGIAVTTDGYLTVLDSKLKQIYKYKLY